MGDTDTFSIDRKSGLIRTLHALDRETMARHEIIVGTEETYEDVPGATTTVEILVDVSIDDNWQLGARFPPMFWLTHKLGGCNKELTRTYAVV